MPINPTTALERAELNFKGPTNQWGDRIVEIEETTLVNAQGAIRKIKRLPITATPTGAEQSTAWQLPTKGFVLDAWVDVKTAEATGGTKTLDLGLLSSEAGGDADGFLAAVSVAATGLKKGTLLNTGQTLGALLCVDESGGGVLVPEKHVLNGTARTVTYTAKSADWAEFRGDLYVEYVEFAT